MTTFEFMTDSGYGADAQAEFYIPDAADCMRCGLCVNTCPTFKINPIAAETPRSRIRTIDNIINRNITVSGTELEHLNNCTQCRACEAICPSRMAYSELFDAARERLGTAGTLPATLGFKLIEHKCLLHAASVLMKLYQKTGLQYVVRRTGLLKRLNVDKAEALLPDIDTSPLAKVYPATRPHRGCIALFTGCVGNHFDRKTLLASITLLNRIGYDVLVPSEQRCCGAIHQHQGKTEITRRMADDNIRIFNAMNIDAIIYTASGCGLMLHEYKQTFTHELSDITAFLGKHWPDNLHLKARTGKVAVHEPCSQRNSLKNQQHVYDLLARIPELSVIPLPENSLCCGAGGVHVLTHPDIAEPLRNAKINHFEQSQAELLVTSNIGCALHLKTGLSQDKVIHPVVLMAAQLP